MGRNKTISARQGFGGKVEGEAIVSREAMHILRTFDLVSGVGRNRDHDLFRRSIVDKVLVFPAPTAGASTAGAFLEMVRNGVGPRGVLANSIDSSTISGFLLSGVPVMSDFDVDITEAIADGDWVTMDTAERAVSVRAGTGAQTEGASA